MSEPLIPPLLNFGNLCDQLANLPEDERHLVANSLLVEAEAYRCRRRCDALLRAESLLPCSDWLSAEFWRRVVALDNVLRSKGRGNRPKIERWTELHYQVQVLRESWGLSAEAAIAAVAEHHSTSERIVSESSVRDALTEFRRLDDPAEKLRRARLAVSSMQAALRENSVNSPDGKR